MCTAGFVNADGGSTTFSCSGRVMAYMAMAYIVMALYSYGLVGRPGSLA